MGRINTNVPAIQAIGRLRRNQDDLTVRLERLATGLRINRGKDDPAGLIASEILRSEIRGLSQAIQNSERAINVISTAEGALNEVSSLILDLRDLIVASANEGAMTADEIAANQLEIDGILSSIDRIGNNTSFGGLKLLDGTRGYTLSGVNDGGGVFKNDLASVAVFAARVPEGSTRNVLVQVLASAETANISFAGAQAGLPQGAGVASFTSATTIEIAGNIGVETLTFASGASLDQIRTAVNDVTSVTGVSAFVSTTAVGGFTSSLVLNSTTYGSASFVTVRPITGNFVEGGSVGNSVTDRGVDASVLINGQRAATKGLQADLRSNGLDTRIFLTPQFAQIQSSTSFTITGGGSIFQITPEVTPIGQVNIGISSVVSSNLGNSVVGFLTSIRSGGGNEMISKNFIAAQGIISEAINQIAVLRGRLGSLQKNEMATSINSQQVALENVTASESVIRDADIAVEVAALTRAQILVSSTQATLQIAVSAPSAVLSLLG